MNDYASNIDEKTVVEFLIKTVELNFERLFIGLLEHYRANFKNKMMDQLIATLISHGASNMLQLLLKEKDGYFTEEEKRKLTIIAKLSSV